MTITVSITAIDMIYEARVDGAKNCIGAAKLDGESEREENAAATPDDASAVSWPELVRPRSGDTAQRVKGHRSL